MQDWLAERADGIVSARAQFADSIERQRVELDAIERRIARARAMADRALDADDEEGADAALRTVVRNEAAREELAAAVIAAEQRLAAWPEDPDTGIRARGLPPDR